MNKIGFIGLGRMGFAIFKAIYNKDKASEFFYSESDQYDHLKITENIKHISLIEIIQLCDVVFLGVKPQQLVQLMNEIAGFKLKSNKKVFKYFSWI